MAAPWNWFIRNAALMLFAVVLAATLGATELFRTTSVIGRALTASDLVRFVGYGAALVLLWLTARNATVVLRERDGRWGALLAHLLLPSASLAVVLASYEVFLLVLDPLMGRAWHEVYNWIFIAGIVGSAGWLVLALFDEKVLQQLLNGASVPRRPALTCQSCGAPLSRSAHHCSRCGTAVAGSSGTECPPG
jgi:hypothetical protein